MKRLKISEFFKHENEKAGKEFLFSKKQLVDNIKKKTKKKQVLTANKKCIFSRDSKV